MIMFIDNKSYVDEMNILLLMVKKKANNDGTINDGVFHIDCFMAAEIKL